MRRRAQAIAAILAALPALILACAGWLKADAAEKSEAKTYQGAALTIGEQADEIYYLKARLDALERRLGLVPTIPEIAPNPSGGPLITGNTINVPGGTGMHVGDTYGERPRP